MPTAVEYAILIPLELPDRWHELCRCVTAEAVGEVMRALCSQGMRGPPQIRVELRILD